MANPKAGPNSSAPTTAEVVGGVYNVTPPVLTDGQATALQVDVNGKLITSGSGGGGGNVNITGVNGPAPALNNPLPVELSDGTQAVGTAGNPLSVNVITGGGSNASVGTTGAAAPASATEIGIVDGTGKLQNVSSTTPLPENVTQVGGAAVATAASGTQKVGIVGSTGTALDGTTAGVLDENIKSVAGSAVATAAAGIQKVGLTDGTGTAITSTGAALDVNVKTTAVTQTVQGNKTNNNAPPGATNIGALTAIANAATPTWTEGDLVGLSVDLAGSLRENTAEWGGTAVSAPPATGIQPTGGEVGPVVKALLRKNQDLVSTATIGSSATFTSAWFDTQTGGGAVQGVLSFLIPSSGFTSNALKFDTTDDNTQTVFTTQQFTPIVNVFGQVYVNLTGRYWRVRFINGATQQTSPILAVTTQASSKTLNPSMGGNIYDGLIEMLNFTTITDVSSAGYMSSANGGGGAAAAVAQFVITSGAGTGSNWAALRTPTTFKTASVTASGNTALWTPTSGKKFRLMRFILDVTDNASLAAGAVVTISFQDSSTPMNIAFDVFIPTTAVTTVLGGYSSGWIDLGNGFLSAAANNVLNVNLSTGLVTTGTPGTVRVTCCGTEE